MEDDTETVQTASLVVLLHNDTWVNADIGLLYYFGTGEPSKYCQLYTGIAEVDYDKIEDIVKRYQTEPCEIDYNRIEDIVKRHCGKAIVQDKWVLIGVNFDFNKATLRPEAYPILRPCCTSSFRSYRC